MADENYDLWCPACRAGLHDRCNDFDQFCICKVCWPPKYVTVTDVKGRI